MNPGFPAWKASGFEDWVRSRYSRKWADMILLYVKHYGGLVENGGDLSILAAFSRTKRNNVLKALIAFSKYLGRYEEFKHRVKNFGLKWENQTSFESFLRITRPDCDFLEWLKQVYSLREDLRVFTLFVMATGLRTAEAIEAFNLIVKLSREDRLREYYDPEKQVLEHFRYPKVFIRGTKNVFISFVPKDLVDRVAACKPVSYGMIRSLLRRRGLDMRFNGFRDRFATYTATHGLTMQEADLLQGRVGKSVFMRHYFTPSIKELGERTLRIVEEMIRSTLKAVDQVREEA
ncbi:MAG: integrase [Thermoproteota archaeon]